MKLIKKQLLEKVAKAAYSTAEKEADTVCFCFGYQPEMPEKVKRLKKRK